MADRDHLGIATGFPLESGTAFDGISSGPLPEFEVEDDEEREEFIRKAKAATCLAEPPS